MSRKKLIVLFAVLIVATSVTIFAVLTTRAEEVDAAATSQCEAIDHFVQIQEYLISASLILSDQEKQLRIEIYENFRDELDCEDPLDPEVIRDAVEGRRNKRGR